MSAPAASRHHGRRLATTLGAIIWSDIRDDLPRIRDLRPSSRVATLLGLVVGLLATATLFVVGPLRDTQPLVPAGSTPLGRTQVVPVVLLPMTIALLAVAWAFLLAGAMHAGRFVRGGVVVLFVSVTLTWVGGSTVLADRSEQVGLALLLGLIVAVALLLDPRRIPPAASFAGFLLLVAALHGSAAQIAARGVRATGVTTPAAILGLMAALARGLVLPLLVLIGVGMASFAVRLADWLSDSHAEATDTRATTILVSLLGVAAAALAVRAVVVAGSHGAVAGALLQVGLAAGAFLVWAPRDGSSLEGLTEAAESIGGRVAVMFFAPAVIATVLMLLVSAGSGLLALLGDRGAAVAGGGVFEGAVTAVTASTLAWRVAFAMGVGAGAMLLRRRQPVLATYLAVLAVTEGWRLLTVTVDWLGPLTVVDPVLLAGWLTVGLAALAIRRPAVVRRPEAIGALVLILLLGQASFLENPLSILLGWAGLGFIVLALAIDALTMGAWANTDSPSLPRTSRLFLYVGYAVFSLTLVAWAAGARDVDQLDLYTGGGALLGFRLFGLPLLVTVVLAQLLSAYRQTAPVGSRGTEEAPS